MDETTNNITWSNDTADTTANITWTLLNTHHGCHTHMKNITQSGTLHKATRSRSMPCGNRKERIVHSV